MKILKTTLLLVASLSTLLTNAQSYVDIVGAGECANAIDISRFKIFGPTTPPEQQKNTTGNAFDLPKHPTWYKFKILKPGILLFDIIPNESKDNYDFILYKSVPDFCKRYKQMKPLRMNLSPSCNPKGMTGLSYSGKAADFEKGVKVKAGDEFYLVLNNVYAGGKGHTIVFKEMKTTRLMGTVKSKAGGKPLKAKVEWRNVRNQEISTESNTEKKGFFLMDVLLERNSNSFPKYELTVSAHKYFPEFKIFSTEEANNLDGKEINFELSKIKKGLNNEAFGVIYFRPNVAQVNANSEYLLTKLLKFMQLNPQAQIRLEGHTNGLMPGTDVDYELSKKRAETVKEFLVKHGIAAERMEIEGFGTKKEVYPIPETEEEEGYNRRVEINILKF